MSSSLTAEVVDDIDHDTSMTADQANARLVANNEAYILIIWLQ